LLPAERSVEVRVEDAAKAVVRVVRITNQEGLHARPADKFATLARKYKASIWVSNSREKVDGKSPMQLVLLEATKGTELLIEAAGSDAEEMVNALERLVVGGFAADAD
jgi:phosphotransferase system HPr (HPr) family protein